MYLLSELKYQVRQQLMQYKTIVKIVFVVWIIGHCLAQYSSALALGAIKVATRIKHLNDRLTSSLLAMCVATIAGIFLFGASRDRMLDGHAHHELFVWATYASMTAMLLTFVCFVILMTRIPPRRVRVEVN